MNDVTKGIRGEIYEMTSHSSGVPRKLADALVAVLDVCDKNYTEAEVVSSWLCDDIYAAIAEALNLTD